MRETVVQMAASYTRPCSTASRSTASTRVCQPRPVARKCASTSGEMRIVTLGLGVSTFGLPTGRAPIHINGLAASHSSSVSGNASGSLMAAAVMAASSSGVGLSKRLPFFKVTYIVVELPRVGFAKTDHTPNLSAVNERDIVQTLPDVAQTAHTIVVVIETSIRPSHGAIPLDAGSFAQRNPVLFAIDGVFGGVEFNQHGIIVPTKLSLVKGEILCNTVPAAVNNGSAGLATLTGLQPLRARLRNQPPINKVRAMNFIAIDVETANPNLSSICQVGVAIFRNGELWGKGQSLVNPEDYFHPLNVSIHGIDEDDVLDAPLWPAIAPQLASMLEGNLVVSHSSFDRTALHRVCQKYSLPFPQLRWLDTTRVVRRTWPQFATSGYGLRNVADFCGIQFQHHDALEDAIAAGHILVHALRHSGMTLEEWETRVARPINPRTARPTKTARPIKLVKNPAGHLFGETLVFTGALSLPRQDAARLAASAGCTVATNVTKRTTLLVAGDQDLRVLKGNTKSVKHRKAEELMAKGQAIRIISEADFLALVDH